MNNSDLFLEVIQPRPNPTAAETRVVPASTVFTFLALLYGIYYAFHYLRTLNTKSARLDVAVPLPTPTKQIFLSCTSSFPTLIESKDVEASPNQSLFSEGNRKTVEPPCATIVVQAEEACIRNGHENHGFLSFKAGFLPLHEPLQSFPPLYSAWDKLIQNMSELISSQSLQAAINSLPVLPADAETLPDRYLHRAATFFCIAAHAYIRLDGDAPLELVGAGGERRVHEIPVALEKPWTEISRRLGRQLPFMSYIDLIVYNWQWKEGVPQDDRDVFTLEKLKLLVPTVDNQEENVFYLTQLELLSKSAPLIRNLVDAQRAVLTKDVNALRIVLREMISTLSHVGRGTLSKVSSRPSSKTYADPVIWTKSVASLAIPLRSDVTGPTGTGSPFFHMMDEFVERSRHNGHLGEEYLRLRAGYPIYWRSFLEAIGKVSVKGFVEDAGDPVLSELWAAVGDAYCGQFGILGLHRRKVFAYLSTSFRIGRTTTIGGFKGKPSDEPWIKVHKELETARQERCPQPQLDSSQQDDSKTSTDPVSTSRRIPVSEVLSHTTKASRYWFSARGKVYDATSYAARHPGGDRIISVSSGRDVSYDLGLVQHFNSPSISAQLARYVIGDLDICRFADNSLLQQLYDFTVALGYRVADQQGTWMLDMSFLHSKMTRVDPEGEITMQKARYFQRAWVSLRSVYAPSIAAHLEAVIGILLLLTRKGCREDKESKLKNLLARVEAIKNGSFPSAPADVQMNTLTMSQAVEKAAATLARLSRIRELNVKLLQLLEHVQMSMDESKINRDFVNIGAELISEVENLGTV